MFKLKCDDFLVYDEATGTYSMSPEQQVRDQTERNRWKNTGFTFLKDWRLYFMLVPMLLVYLLWKYAPMTGLLAAFRFGGSDVVSERPWVGFANFRVIFAGAESAGFWTAFRNTFVIAFYGLVFGFPLPIILALFLNEVRSNAVRSVMQVFVLMPKFISAVIVTSLTVALFANADDSQGVLSRLLNVIGSEHMKEAIEGNGAVYTVEYFRAIYIITDMWEHAGYDSIVFLAALVTVSPTSYEAARIDGAGKMAQMRYVVIPSILSTVVVMLIMKIGGLLSVGYEKLYLFGGEGNYEVAEVVPTWANGMADSCESRAFGIAGELTVNLLGTVLVIASNTIARKVSDVSLY